MEKGTFQLKSGLAEMLKGGVIMDVTTPEQAKIAQEAGACAVMALERVPADIRKAGGVARMADPSIVLRIMDAVTIPVMAKARIGHIVEARILESLGVDYIDESEVLTPADDRFHIDKRGFTVPFVCGARNLGEALRRIAEGASMIRTKGEPGTGNVVEAVRHCRMVLGEIRALRALPEEEVANFAKENGAPLELVLKIPRRRPPPCGELRRWRHRHARRCRPHDAARPRRCVRRLRHLQIHRPGQARQGHCRRRDPLQ